MSNHDYKVVVEPKWDDDGNMTYDVLGFDPDNPILKFARDTVKDALCDADLLKSAVVGDIDGERINEAVARALRERVKFEHRLDDNTAFTVKADVINPGVQFGIKIKF